MKKLIIPFLIAVTLVFQACEPTEPTLYDGSQTLAYFDGVSATLEVEINATGEITIPVNVSTLSSSERTVTVSAVEAASSATAGQYSFNSAVTIPANTYFGSMTLTGIDDGLTTDGVVLILQIDSVDGGSPSPDTYQVRIVEICPIESTFAVGNYTAVWQSGGIPAAGFAPLIGNGETVELSVGAGSTERTFRTKIYPTFPFGSVMQWTFGLICEEIITQDQLETEGSGVACNPNPAILVGGTGGGSYVTGDDSTLTLVYLEDAGGGSCGTEGTTTIQLNKQ
jgi:hypothetical protein